MQSVPVNVPSAVSPLSPSSGTPAQQPPSNPRIFEEALRDFKKGLSKKELVHFEFVDFKDVEDTIKKIEFGQKMKKKMQNIARIKPFLDAMRQYGKIIEVFLNTSNIIAYIWGPIKLLLTVSSTFVTAFECVLSAYEELGECLPLYSQYEEYFHSNPDMRKMLGYVYKDLLSFHARVYKVMSGSMWKNVFDLTRPSFSAALTEIRTNFLRHKDLVEKQANLLHFDLYRRHHEEAESRFQQQERVEIRKQQMEVLEWLAMTSTETTPATDQEHYASKRKDYPASGQWLSSCREYQEWLDPMITHIPCIWLNGKPGAGKTVLASYIIEQACKVPEFDVGWFYCKFNNKDKSTLLAVIRGIIAQLVKANGKLRPHILEAKNRTGDLKLISSQVGKDLMAECLQVLEKTFIIIDGLDECDKDARGEIISLFIRLAKAQNDAVPGSFRILFVSTDEVDIRKPLSKAVSIALKSTDNFGEMEDYARVWTKRVQELHALTDQEVEEIVSKVMKRADGMYLYCYLVFSNLYAQLTREDLDRELQPDCLPRGLGDAYDKILHRINTHSEQPYRVYAVKILGWLACSRRPLKWHEIQGAMCMGTNDGTFDQRRRLRVNAKELCGALVELQCDETVQFVHTSAREYIIRQRYQSSASQLSPTELEPWIDIASARSQAALTCVQYLALDCFRMDLTDDEVRDFVQKGYYCFQDYAVVYWYDHVEISLSGATRGSLVPDSLLSALGLFLTRNWNPLKATEQAKKDKCVPVKVAQRLQTLKGARFPEVFRKLTAFASAREKLGILSPFLNLSIPVGRARALLEGQHELDLSTAQVHVLQQFYGHGFSHFKCRQENCLHFSQGFACVRERQKHDGLHDRGFRCSEITCPSADIGFTTNAGLQSHMMSQHPQNVVFHETEVDCTFNDGYASVDDTFIVEASGQGQLDIVSSLVRDGIDINTQDEKGMTALHRASLGGHHELVRFLLEVEDIALSVEDTNGATALMQAAESGHEAVVKLLLDHGADSEAKSNSGDTALIGAARRGHAAVVKLLLDHGADSKAQGAYGDTALIGAAEGGHEAVVKLLLDYGADSNAQNSYGTTALIEAAKGGHKAVVKLLLDHGADSNAQGNSGDTALIGAAKGGHEAVVKLLLDDGADSNAQNMYGTTALTRAAEGGHEAVVKLLLDHGADSNAQNKYGNTALIEAARSGHAAVVELLLDHDADSNAQGEEGSTALIEAAYRGHEAVVRLLLDSGADSNAQNSYGTTALIEAAEGGHEAVVKLLLDPGADSNAQNKYGTTALTRAAEGGHEAVVKLLLDNGADSNAQNKYGNTTLIEAARRGHAAVVELLLDHDADSNAQGEEGSTALIEAAYRGHEAVVRLLLDSGADSNAQNKYDTTALILAAERGHEAVVKLLLDHGADSNPQDTRDTALIRAAEGGHEAVVKLLLDHGADSNAQNNSGDTVLPVILAAGRGDEAVVKLLLEHGADSNAHGNSGDTVLILAAGRGDEAAVKLLLDHGADFNAHGEEGSTALIEAARAGREAVARLLLERDDVDVNLQDKDGNTALMRAVDRGLQPVVKLLLARFDVDPNVQDKDGNTALMRAVDRGLQPVVKLLLARLDVDVNVQDKNGKTALMRATGKHNNRAGAMVRLLREHNNMNMDAKNTSGQSGEVLR